MNEKESHNNTEPDTEQNYNMIDCLLNDTLPTPVPAPKDRPLDRIKPPTEKKRSRERER